MWVGSHFVNAEMVAFQSPVDAAPYLHSVPHDVACFSALLQALGVRPSFGPSDYVSTLAQMARETRGGTALAPPLIIVAVALVQALSDSVAGAMVAGDRTNDCKVLTECLAMPRESLIRRYLPQIRKACWRRLEISLTTMLRGWRSTQVGQEGV